MCNLFHWPASFDIWKVIAGRINFYLGSQKNSWIARGFAREYLRSFTGYGPGRSVKRRSKSCSLHSKNNFWLGGAGFFVSDVISGGLFGHLGQLHLALGANR